MKPPRFKQFTAEQYSGAPSWFSTQFLPQLSESLSGLVNGLTKGITRSDNLAAAQALSVQFTTKTPASKTWPMAFKNQLATKPNHLHIGQIYRQDGKVMANAFSPSWVVDGQGNIQLTVLGLEDGIGYVMSINYE